MISTLTTACSPISLDVEDLISPPKLSAQQEEIHIALQEYTNSNNPKIYYPKNGDYRSAFIMYDVDLDGFDEAVVFSQVNGFDDNIHLVVMAIVDGKWRAVGSFPIKSNSIDSIDSVIFPKMIDQNAQNLVVGYNINKNQKIFEVFSFNELQPKHLYYNFYDEIATMDINKDNLTDIFTITHDSNKNFASIISKHGSFSVNLVDTIELSEIPSMYLNITLGNIANYKEVPAIYLDMILPENLSNHDIKYATEIISFENKKFTNRTMFSETIPYTENSDDVRLFTYTNILQTVRNFPLYSEDIDQDGIIEIPTTTPLYASDSQPSSSIQYLVTYKQCFIDPANNTTFFQNVSSKYISDNQQFEILFPEAWNNNITVIKDSVKNEWTFAIYSQPIIHETDYVLDVKQEKNLTEILKIRAFNTSVDYKDNHEVRDYFYVGNHNKNEETVQYYAKILPVEQEFSELMIDEVILSEILRIY